MARRRTLASAVIGTGACLGLTKATTTDRIPRSERAIWRPVSQVGRLVITDLLEVTVTISVNEQVPGHKVTVRPAARTKTSQRRASCECGWESQIGSTEQVMPEIRTHLEAAFAAGQRRVGQPTEPGSRSFPP
jgi:hypothetical protein